MCNFKKGILIMKNLSNIKTTLAVSMLLSASLFSTETLEKSMAEAAENQRRVGQNSRELSAEGLDVRAVTMGDRLIGGDAGVYHGDDAGIIVQGGLVTAEARYNQVLNQDTNMFKLYTKAQARREVLESAQSDVRALREVLSRCNNEDVSDKRLGADSSLLVKLTLQSSRHSDVRNIQKVFNELDYKVAELKSRLSSQEEDVATLKLQSLQANAALDQHRKRTAQFIGDSYEGNNSAVEDFAGISERAKKPSKCAGMTVTYKDRKKTPDYNSANLLAAAKEGIADDRYETTNHPTLKKYAEELQGMEGKLAQINAELEKRKSQVRETEAGIKTLKVKRINEEKEALYLTINQSHDDLARQANTLRRQYVELIQCRRHDLSAEKKAVVRDGLKAAMTCFTALIKHKGTEYILVNAAGEHVTESNQNYETANATYNLAILENTSYSFQTARIAWDVEQVREQAKKCPVDAINTLTRRIDVLKAQLVQHVANRDIHSYEKVEQRTPAAEAASDDLGFSAKPKAPQGLVARFAALLGNK